MNKNDIFEKNEKRLVKKATVYGLAIILIAGTFIPIVNSYREGDCNPIINLPPDPVTMMLFYNPPISIFTTMLSDVPSGCDVTNDSYLGWCADPDTWIPLILLIR